MTKRAKYKHTISAKLKRPAEVEALMLDECGLPGPRANLELAAAFVDVAGDGSLAPDWWERINGWARLTAMQAPANHPMEFLPFVAVQALASEGKQNDVGWVLRSAANDARWRMREACAFGLQRIGSRDPDRLMRLVRTWMDAPTLLELRATLTGLADPGLLTSEALRTFALACADDVMRRALELPPEDIASDRGKVLVKALGFAPSVYVAAEPEAGFRMLEDWADIGSPLAVRAVAANLRKARLAKHFEREVQDVVYRLEAVV